MTTLRVNWRAPLHANGVLTNYIVNLTSLKTFDDRPVERAPGVTEVPSSQSIVMPHAVQIKVGGSSSPGAPSTIVCLHAIAQHWSILIENSMFRCRCHRPTCPPRSRT